jgi:hypothetical protein
MTISTCSPPATVHCYHSHRSVRKRKSTERGVQSNPASSESLASLTDGQILQQTSQRITKEVGGKSTKGTNLLWSIVNAGTFAGDSPMILAGVPATILHEADETKSWLREWARAG